MAINLDRIQAPKLETPTTSLGGSLEANTTYYYCVVCVGGLNTLASYPHHFESPRSNIVSITTTSTERTVNLSWSAPTITQSGKYHTPSEEHDNYAVLRSTDIADLQGREKVPILINASYAEITTTTNSYTDDNTTKTASGTKSYFWYRPHGCPKIHITGYSSTTPCTMADLYNADLAGTLELMPSLPASGSPHRLYTPVNPADSKQLTLTIIVTNFVSSGTVELHGKDAGGDAKSETISITGNGTYNTTLSYASIDEDGIICTGEYDLKIIQNRWGFIEKHRVQFGNNLTKAGSNNWTIHCSFYNEGYFSTKREKIFIVGGFNPGISNNAHFTAGELSSSGTGRNGSYIGFVNRRWFARMNGPGFTNVSLYASIVQYADEYMETEVANTATWYGADGDYRISATNTLTMVDTIFDIPCGHNGFLVTSAPTIKRGLLVGAVQPRGSLTVDFNGLNLIGGPIAHQDSGIQTISNLNVYGLPYEDIFWWTSSAYTPIITYVNCTFHRSADAEKYNEPYYVFNSSAFYYTKPITEIFKSEFKVIVIDINGLPIKDANVKIVRSDGVTEFEGLTDENGGYGYVQLTYCTTAGDGTISGASSGYATNNRGGLTPVTPKMVATQYTHTITISKDGYQTYTSELDMSSKKDLVIKLEKAVDLIFPRSGGKLVNLDSANPQNDVLWK